MATTSTASAQPQTSYAEVKNVVQTGAQPDQAVVTVKYRCTGFGVHLWASAKQGPDLDPSLPMGSGTTAARADSWYETPEGPAPTCDGKNHVERYTITRVDGWDRLGKGEAWVQFVFFYVDGQGQQARAADVGWQTVR